MTEDEPDDETGRNDHQNDETEAHDEERDAIDGDDNGTDKQGDADREGVATPADGTESQQPGDTDDDQTDLSAELESLRGRIDDLESDLTDYQRRTEHELEELRKYTVEDLASELLEVKKSLEDAIEVEELDEGTEQRLNIVVKQFEKRLTSGRIEAYEPEPGETFNSKYHKVADKVSAENYDEEEIVRVLTTGYRTHDRVIRPAGVVVASN